MCMRLSVSVCVHMYLWLCLVYACVCVLWVCMLVHDVSSVCACVRICTGLILYAFVCVHALFCILHHLYI